MAFLKKIRRLETFQSELSGLLNLKVSNIAISELELVSSTSDENKEDIPKNKIEIQSITKIAPINSSNMQIP